jgi:hypothetical protein
VISVHLVLVLRESRHGRGQPRPWRVGNSACPFRPTYPFRLTTGSKRDGRPSTRPRTETPALTSALPERPLKPVVFLLARRWLPAAPIGSRRHARPACCLTQPRPIAMLGTSSVRRHPRGPEPYRYVSMSAARRRRGTAPPDGSTPSTRFLLRRRARPDSAGVDNTGRGTRRRLLSLNRAQRD